MTVGGAPMVPDSPMPLTPSGLVLHGTSSSVALDVRHHVGARHGVVHEAAGQELAGLAVVDLVLHQRLADALHHAALDLAAHDHRIDDAAEIVDHEVAVDRRPRRSRDRPRPRRHAQPLGWLGGVGSKLPVASRPTPNFAGERPHRRVGRLGDVDEADRLVGAGDAEAAVLELDVAGVGLHHARRRSSCPSRSWRRRRPSAHCRRPPRCARHRCRGRSRPARCRPARSGCCSNGTPSHLVRELREHRGVALAVRMGAAERW